jgi:hypothetical protein
MTAACSVCSAPAFSRLLSILNAVGDAGSTCYGAGGSAVKTRRNLQASPCRAGCTCEGGVSCGARLQP